MSGSTHYMIYEELDRSFKKYYLLAEEYLLLAQRKEAKEREIFFKKAGRSFILSRVKEYGVLTDNSQNVMTNGIRLCLDPNEFRIAKEIIRDTNKHREINEKKKSVWFKDMRDYNEFMKKIEKIKVKEWERDNPEKAQKWSERLSDVFESRDKNMKNKISLSEYINSTF